LLVERVKLQGAPKEEKANDDLQAKKSIRDRELDRQRELEKDIANCVITAPRDGVVVYYVPEQQRGQPPIVAQGEPVRENQRLMSIVDLTKMAVSARVPEAAIAKVRPGQKVKVLVDALPGRTFAGKVTEVATAASQADFLFRGVKDYQTTITLDGENKDLKPGLSAETTIIIGDQPNCLRLPAPAVLGKGKGTFCYVLTGKELHVRKITVGLSDANLVEITNGLKEGELVLRDPSAVIGRLLEKLP
jgi:HlyD family secretion protein